MPLTQEQKDAIKAAVAGIAGDDITELTTEIKNANQTAFQAIYRGGFKEAETRYKPRASEADERVAEAERKLAEAEEKVRELTDKSPDVAKINAEWADKLTKAKDKAAADLATVRAEADTVRRSHRDSLLRLELTRQGLDPLYVDTALTKHGDRIRANATGYELVEAGGETPVQLDGDSTPFAALAKEIADAADPRWKVSAQSGGAGDRGEGAPAKGYDPVADGKARAEAAKKQRDTSLALK